MRFVRPDGSQYRPDHFLTYDDVLLVPRRSSVRSRSDVDLSCTLGPVGRGLRLTLPILSSNMDTVTGEAMAKAMGELGALGVLHRFVPIGEQEQSCGRLSDAGLSFAFSIGVGPEERTRLSRSVAAVADVGKVAACVDVAHGHLDLVMEMVDHAKQRHPELLLIAGNVATAEGALELVEKGAGVVKVGVGPGSMCTTRLVTGFGVPQLSAVAQVAQAVGGRASVVADGGIRTSGDAVKALAAGAEAVMLGRYLASAEEAPGQVMVTPAGRQKVFRGMASRAAQVDWKGGIPEGLAPEGEDTLVGVTGPVSALVQRFCGGMRSGFAYGGAHRLEELRANALFVEVSAGTRGESGAHGK